MMMPPTWWLLVLPGLVAGVLLLRFFDWLKRRPRK